MNVANAACDRGSAQSAASGDAPHPGWVLAASILASSLAFVDGSVVNVALPAMGKDLSADAPSLQWVLNAYLLPLSALLLIGGAAGDHFGRKRLLIGGVAAFVIASVLCALAPGLDFLLAARALQGASAAMLMPNSLAILGNAFSGEARGRAIGTWAAVGAMAGAIGPPLGGWLIGTVGWRGIFYLNVPVGLAAIAVAARYVPANAESPGKARPLDWTGATSVTIALGLLTWALTIWSSAHRLTLIVGLGLGLGTIAMAAFLAVERQRGDRAMMPLAMFASAPFVGLTLLTFLLYGALGGLLVLIPFVLIVAAGWTPLAAGLALLPFPALIGLLSRSAGRLSESIGPRALLGTGPLIVAAGFALLATADPRGSYWTSLLPAIVVIALGMAGAVAPLTTAVLASVDGAHTGTASGFNSAIARTGGLIATALVGGVIARTGPALVAAFSSAAWAGAALAAVSGIAAWATLGAKPRAGAAG